MGTFDQTVRLGDQLYALLPERWRSLDHSPITISPLGIAEKLSFHNRLMRVFGDAQEDILEALRAVLGWYDPLVADSDILSHLSQNVGWALDTSLTDGQQRLLIKHVCELIYRGKHKIADIQAALRAVTGLSTIECVAYNNYPTQGICDESLSDDGATAGISDGRQLARADATDTGYSCDEQALCAYGDYNDLSADDRELQFTFAVRTPVLTAQQTKIINFS